MVLSLRSVFVCKIMRENNKNIIKLKWIKHPNEQRCTHNSQFPTNIIYTHHTSPIYYFMFMWDWSELLNFSISLKQTKSSGKLFHGFTVLQKKLCSLQSILILSKYSAFEFSPLARRSFTLKCLSNCIRRKIKNRGKKVEVYSSKQQKQ